VLAGPRRNGLLGCATKRKAGLKQRKEGREKKRKKGERERKKGLIFLENGFKQVNSNSNLNSINQK
jgi:hypothetical protein